VQADADLAIAGIRSMIWRGTRNSNPAAALTKIEFGGIFQRKPLDQDYLFVYYISEMGYGVSEYGIKDWTRFPTTKGPMRAPSIATVYWEAGGYDPDWWCYV